MAVRTNLKLCAVFALSIVSGCAGNLIAGVPPDGGDEDIGNEPGGSVGDAGGRDSRASSMSDASPAATKDASGGNMTPEPDEDSGPTVAEPDAGTMLPPVGEGRDLSTDKAKFLGTPRCDKAGALFCDDFESQAAGAQPGPAWGYPFAYKPTIDTTRAARGTKSLKFSVNTNTPAQIEEIETFPAANNTIYGRMFVWMAAVPSAATNVHYTLVAGRGTGSMNEVRLDGMYRSNVKLNYYGVGSDGPLDDTDGDGKDDDDWHIDGKEPQSILRATDWTCLEWQFKGDTNETRIWIDGVEQTSLHTTTDAYFNGGKFSDRSFVHPQYTGLRIGWWVYQSSAMPSPFELWIDEVAIDKDRIGCVL